MSDPLSAQLPCPLLAGLIVVFVIGYAAAWYKYNVPPVHVVVRKSEPMSALKTPIRPPGPGSERFYTKGDDGPLNEPAPPKEEPEDAYDHDNQVISRMRK